MVSDYERYAARFGSNENGYAHPDDSLALAENLAPGDILGGVGAIDPTGVPSLYLGLAWRLIEYPLATPEHTGDAEYFARAKQLVDVVHAFHLSITDPVSLNAKLLDEYLPSFVVRAAGEVPPAPLKDLLRGGIAHLMDLFMAVSPEDNTPEFAGRLSELIVHYGLLAAGRTIYLASPRQEANIFTPDNHDLDCIDSSNFVAPVSVKHIGAVEPAEASEGGVQHDEDDLPLVALLRVGVIAKEAWDTVEASRDEAHRAPPITNLGATCRLARTMIWHAQGRTLTRRQTDFLRLSVAGFCRVIDDYKIAHTAGSR